MSRTETVIAPLFEFTAEHEALREVLRAFFDVVATADATQGWQRLLVDIGVADIFFGGDDESGGTPVDLAIVAEAAGAALFDGPVLAAGAAGALLAQADTSVTGELRAGRLAPALGAAWLGADTRALQLCGPADRTRVRGRVGPVWDLRGAGLIVCEADLAGECAVVGLATDTAGVSVTQLSGLDPSRSLSRVDCDDAAPVFVRTTPSGCGQALRRRGEIVLSAELLGLAQHVLERTVDYVAHRVQFGRTIGSFQAVKHRLADLLAQVELTRSAVYAAAWRLTYEPSSAATDIDVAVAAALAADTATTITEAAVQLHGGIAITWEHWAHRYLRRAHAVAALTGGAPRQRQRLATLWDVHHD